MAPLIEFAESDWKAPRTSDETERMETNARTANKIYIACIFLGNCTVNSYTLLRAGQELGFLPGPPEKRLPLFDAYFPYDDKPTPVYEITWVMQYLGAALANMAFTGMYCLFVGLILHLCSQFGNLRTRLVQIVVDETNGEKKTRGDEFQEKLAFIVQRHDRLNK